MSEYETFVPVPLNPAVLDGIEIPACPNAHDTNPEQSNPLGLFPAHRYGVPRYGFPAVIAVLTLPFALTVAGAPESPPSSLKTVKSLPDEVAPFELLATWVVARKISLLISDSNVAKLLS